MPDRACWLFTRSKVTDGVLVEPLFPDGVTGSFTSPCELHRIEGPDHIHVLIGGVALKSAELVDDYHTHYVAWFNGQYRQDTVDGESHTHTLNVTTGDEVTLIPQFYLLFWYGTEADYQLIDAFPQNIVAVLADTSEEGKFGDLDSTPWTVQEKIDWDELMLNHLGVRLPEQINSGDRLVAFFVGALVGRPQQKEFQLRQYILDPNALPVEPVDPYPK